MAGLIWTEPALNDLDAIADYIAIDDEAAAKRLVQRVLAHVEQLRTHPESGPPVPELPESRYRQLTEPPCRIFYRYDGRDVIILHLMRSERRLKKSALAKTRRKQSRPSQ